MVRLPVALCITASLALSVTFPAYADKTKDAAVERGKYLTTILGCGQCHTEGALQGTPYGPYLAGSRIGIAYTAFDPMELPAIVFPGNLTSHKRTGLGRWKKGEIVEMIRTGINHRGERAITVMPWINYSLLNDTDVSDIADYLMSVPPVKQSIPENLPAGDPQVEPFVRFGIYVFDPGGKLHTLREGGPHPVSD